MNEPDRKDVLEKILVNQIDWQAVVAEYGSTVWAVAYRLLRDRADAEDCFQETFVSAWQMARQRPVRTMRALLIRIATTKAIDRLRYRARRLQRGQVGLDWEVPSGDRDPARVMADRELADEIRAALAQLPPQQATAFCLRFLNDMSQREIGRELGINTGTAGVLIHRARKKLEQLLKEGRVCTDEVSS